MHFLGLAGMPRRIPDSLMHMLMELIFVPWIYDHVIWLTFFFLAILAKEEQHSIVGQKISNVLDEKLANVLPKVKLASFLSTKKF